MSKVSLAIETEKAGLKQVLLWRKLGKKVGFTNGCLISFAPWPHRLIGKVQGTL